MWGDDDLTATGDYSEYILDELPSPPTTTRLATTAPPPSSPNNGGDDLSLESDSSQGFGKVSTDSEWEAADEGSQELFSATPPSESGTNLTNESETINVNSNIINSKDVESSETVQVSDEVKDSVRVGKGDHPSSGGGQAPQGGPPLSGIATSPRIAVQGWGLREYF